MLTVDTKKYKAFCRQALITCGVKEEAGGGCRLLRDDGYDGDHHPWNGESAEVLK